MPIIIPNQLPARSVLESENIFVMNYDRATSQQIRPLKILLLNLMPLMIVTETQLCRLLGNTPLQVEMEFLMMSREHKHTPASHLSSFYQTFEEVRHKNYDGMVITGAPVEHLPFEEVDYWDDLCEVMEWSKTHVHSTFHICWGAQAALYYHYGIKKVPLPEKMFGIFEHTVTHKGSILFRGFDDVFMVPHSRHTTVLKEDILNTKGLKILSESETAGVYAISTDGGRQIFITGHSEYDPDTLEKEYLRDKNAGLPIKIPYNYYPDDDDTKRPVCTWRSCAHMLYSNWLNYFVYQSTPYDLNELSQEK
ncbi:MAG: homoserine O-succinyltransferase [Solobacterium sp.]|nr:homoserine O-succinyltransferase [Solobacterium sp.]